MGIPQAEAASAPGHIYWEKVDQDGKPLGGASFTLRFKGETLDWARERAAHSEFGDAPTSFGIIDNVNFDPYGPDMTDVEKMSDNPTGRYLLSDLDPRPGHFLVADPLTQLLLLYNTTSDYVPTTQRDFQTYYKLDEWVEPEGYGSCPFVENEIEFVAPSPDGPYESELLDNGQYRHTLRKNAFVDLEEGTGWGEVTDENFRPGAGHSFREGIGLDYSDDPKDFSVDKHLYERMARLPDEVISDDEEIYYGGLFEQLVPNDEIKTNYIPIYTVGSLSNCRDDYNEEPSEEPTPTPSTTTETPEPSTTTVTPPTTTVTLPSTVTTTVTPPATTVTETPKTETTMAMTTESATTTVTETPQTETVTETPERETVTLTPEKETETVTETPKQVTETTTLPQKTVTEQVPATIVEDKTEFVKLPPVTVTETEKQESVTVTETPEKVPGATVVETKSGEPTVVSSPPSVEVSAPVETTMPSESETSTPAPEEKSTTSRVLASTGANAVGLMVLSGLVVGVGVFVIRRRK